MSAEPYDLAAPRALESLAGRTVHSVTCGPESTAAVLSPVVFTVKEKAAMSKGKFVANDGAALAAGSGIGGGGGGGGRSDAIR